jgi:hypothetical protein
MNLFAGWASILLGFVAGAVPGLSFWREDWLGGYGSWRRRMVRLAHIAFFGLGFINLAFAFNFAPREAAALTGALHLAAVLLVAGNVTMPAVCYLAAWRQPFRHLFAVPVLCEVVGVALVLLDLLSG